MSRFGVGDKVELDFDGHFYHACTGKVEGVDDRLGRPLYQISLDVGGRIAASETHLVEPGTRKGGTWTYRVEYRESK